jgi:aspartyl-tRNA(Asn)/glutamyl-tRNA(Gln) amidotransferase subunit C
MALTTTDVRRIAELARLKLGTDEEARLLEQLNSFFRIVELMGQVDTSGVEPRRWPRSAMRTCACATTRSPKSTSAPPTS